MTSLRLHIVFLILVFLPALGWGQQEIRIDDMPEAFFGNWRSRNGGSMWRLETKPEYLGADNNVWRYRRIMEDNGVYTVDVEYIPPVPESAGDNWKQTDPVRGTVHRYIFSNIQPGSMTIDNQYQNYKYQAIIKEPGQNFRRIEPASLPAGYMGTWVNTSISYTEEMKVSRENVEVNGMVWDYFEIMRDGNQYRIVLRHKDQFHIWVPKMEGSYRINSMFYPYSKLIRKTSTASSQTENQETDRDISASELPGQLLGNWQDGSGIWQFQIKKEYFGVDNQLWTYQKLHLKNGTYQLDIINSSGSKKQYSFRVISNGLIQTLDPYRGSEYELTAKPTGQDFYQLQPHEIPPKFMGIWSSSYGNGTELILNHESVIVDGNQWKYHEIIVYRNEYRFTLVRNGRYHLWIPKLSGNDEITSVFDRNLKLQLQRRLSESELRSKRGSSSSQIADNLPDISEDNFKRDSAEEMTAATLISGLTLPESFYGNWNSRNGEWVFDIQKTYLSMEHNAWQYDDIRQEGETYFLEMSRRSGDGKETASQQLSMRLISNYWMEVIREGIRFEVLAMPFNDSFYLVHANDLPESLLGSWYHTSGEDSLTLRITHDSLFWRGLPMAYEQIIRKTPGFFITGKRGDIHRVFQIESMENGFLQVALDDQNFLFNRQPVLPSPGKLILLIFLVLVAVSALMWLFFRWRSQNLQRKEIAKRREIELELKALRSQMNPHFLFNSLNSIQNLINKQDPDQANHYLSRFSSLMRKVLNNTESTFITLEEETAILGLYCELEALRFQFDFEITIHPELDVYNTEIPGMLIQPFVENAIRHGIGPSEQRGRLKIHFQQEGELICCVVDDNGIGIQASLAQKKVPAEGGPRYGIRLAEERLEMIHRHYGDEVSIEIVDKGELNPSETGTRIQMYLPTNLS